MRRRRWHSVELSQFNKMEELGISSEFWAPGETEGENGEGEGEGDGEQRRRRRRFNDQSIAKAVRCTSSPPPDPDDAMAWAVRGHYSGVPPVHEISQAEMDLISSIGGGAAAHVYGELTQSGSRHLLRLLAPGSSDTLYDLGSGAGRFVLQAAMEHPLLHCVGVELSETRHDAGAVAARRAALPNLTLVHADLLVTPLDKATLVFVASLAFGERLLHRLAGRLAKLPKLRAVGLLGRSLPPDSVKAFHDAFELEIQEPPLIGVTWGVARLYIYRRRGLRSENEVT